MHNLYNELSERIGHQYVSYYRTLEMITVSLVIEYSITKNDKSGHFYVTIGVGSGDDIKPKALMFKTEKDVVNFLNDRKIVVKFSDRPTKLDLLRALEKFGDNDKITLFSGGDAVYLDAVESGYISVDEGFWVDRLASFSGSEDKDGYERAIFLKTRYDD